GRGRASAGERGRTGCDARPDRPPLPEAGRAPLPRVAGAPQRRTRPAAHAEVRRARLAARTRAAARACAQPPPPRPAGEAGGGTGGLEDTRPRSRGLPHPAVRHPGHGRRLGRVLPDDPAPVVPRGDRPASVAVEPATGEAPPAPAAAQRRRRGSRGRDCARCGRRFLRSGLTSVECWLAPPARAALGADEAAVWRPHGPPAAP